MKGNYIIDKEATEDRARVWVVTYTRIAAKDEAEALLTAELLALRDVPNAHVRALRVRQTPSGRYSVTLKRTREEETR